MPRVFLVNGRPWSITDGDMLVSPPKHRKGKLNFKRDGTFRLSVLFEFGLSEVAAGKYHVHGNLIFLKSTSTSTADGRKKARQTFQLELFQRSGQLWDGGYLTGDGSFIFVRPGKIPKMPRSDKDWPSTEDFSP